MYAITRKVQEFITPDDTVLDVMCGRCMPTKELVAKFKVGVDVYEPSLEIAQDYCLPMKLDVRKLAEVFLPGSFDVALWMDGPEHLEKVEAIHVLDMLQAIARKRVIIFTPTDFFNNHDSDEYKNEGTTQEHRCCLEAEFFQWRGYQTHPYVSKKGIHSVLAIKELNGCTTDT